jgi:hypothetical protein
MSELPVATEEFFELKWPDSRSPALDVFDRMAGHRVRVAATTIDSGNLCARTAIGRIHTGVLQPHSIQRKWLVSESWIADRMHKIDASGIRKVFDLAATMTRPVNLSIG